MTHLAPGPHGHSSIDFSNYDPVRRHPVLTIMATAAITLAVLNNPYHSTPQPADSPSPTPSVSAIPEPAKPSASPTADRLSRGTCDFVGHLLNELTWREDRPVQLGKNMGTFVMTDSERADLEHSITIKKGKKRVIPDTTANQDVRAAITTAKVLDKAALKVVKEAERRDMTPQALRWAEAQNQKLVPLKDQAVQAAQHVKDTYC